MSMVKPLYRYAGDADRGDASHGSVRDLFALASRELDRRDAANSAGMRHRHDVTAWFFLNEGWRRLHGGDAIAPTRH
jgi:hypothetical protein